MPFRKVALVVLVSSRRGTKDPVPALLNGKKMKSDLPNRGGRGSRWAAPHRRPVVDAEDPAHENFRVVDVGPWILDLYERPLVLRIGDSTLSTGSGSISNSESSSR